MNTVDDPLHLNTPGSSASGPPASDRPAAPWRTAPTPPARTGTTGASAQAWTTSMLSQWLVDQRNATITPDVIAAELVGNGWDADTAARTSLRSLRSADRQTLTYASLTLSAGFGALAAATAAHLMLDGNPDPMRLTIMLTIALVAVPLAGVIGHFSRLAEARSRYVLWSASRRGWFGALALCTGAVGTFRLLAYLFSAIATLTGASSEPFSIAAANQVMIALGISVPMFVWSFREWRRSNLVISALADDEALAAS